MKKRNVAHKLISVILVNALLLVGCVNPPAHPVDRYNPGDEKRVCPALLSELGEIDNEITTRQAKIGDREFWNVILFLGGLAVIVPFFFINVSKANETEITAYKARKSHLKNIAFEKNCAVVESGDDQEN